jgi:hypothetical protein
LFVIIRIPVSAGADEIYSGKYNIGILMKKLIILALISFPFHAYADSEYQLYLSGGDGTGGTNVSVGVGTQTAALEISSINLDQVESVATPKFTGISLVQNPVQYGDFSLPIRIGFGRVINDATFNTTSIGKSLFYGVGLQYKLYSHLALRGEWNHIEYAASSAGVWSRTANPVTLSMLFFF